jgi:hypothetical protein
MMERFLKEIFPFASTAQPYLTAMNVKFVEAALFLHDIIESAIIE